ncbi:Ger(x)C family spore germination protein [Thalassobacillus sp. CUG 92003]|uniref:Ger(x)C family spore germination protein n=1 Tax=Thalassobacillus sp. CUG 92003 TaxID=2736641 RepID=UPI0015E79DB6|nr:Ger(x)C family spore germination protein [Thalassobacillus sp. CUG 92003]
MRHPLAPHGYVKWTLVWVVMVLTLTGCWSSRELDELGVAVAIGVDKDEDDRYVLSVQIINPSEVASDAPTTRPPVTLYTTTGDTLFQAFRNMTTHSPRKVYVSQLRMVVLGPEIVNEGVTPALDLLYRNHEFRPTFFVTVARDASVSDILSTLTPYERIPAKKLMDSLIDTEENLGITKSVTIDNLIADVRSNGKEAVLPGILMEGDAATGTSTTNVEKVDAPTKLSIDGLSIFRGDQLVGWLKEEESQGYNYATGTVQSTIETFACDNPGTLSVEILRSNASMDAQLRSGKPTITIRVEVEGNVGEVDCVIDLSDDDKMKDINKKTEEVIEKKINAAINVTQEEYASDIFGFGNVIHRNHPAYWKQIKYDWKSHFSELEVKTDVKVKIRRKGKSTQPLQSEG